MLDFILRHASLQRHRQIGPEPVEPGVRHFQNPADIGWTVLIKKQCRLRGIRIARVYPVACSLQEAKGEQGVREIRNGPRVKPEH